MQKFYAVKKGRTPGIYLSWETCAPQVTGFPGAIYKSFETRAAAEQFMAGVRPARAAPSAAPRKPAAARPAAAKAVASRPASPPAVATDAAEGLAQVTLYTDGGCFVNPGPGGYGVVLLAGKERREASGGFRLTTNNRMELMGCIAGLRLLSAKSAVTIHTDSRYVTTSMTKGWVKRWQAMHWRRDGEPVPNADLWRELLAQCERHVISFVWLRGHTGQRENERCHALATQAMQQPNLPVDSGYDGE